MFKKLIYKVIIIVIAVMFAVLIIAENKDRLVSDTFDCHRTEKMEVNPQKAGALLAQDPEENLRIYEYGDGMEGFCLLWKGKWYFLKEPGVAKEGELKVDISDYDKDGEKEKSLILRYYEEGYGIQNRIYVFEEQDGELYWNVYDPALDIAGDFEKWVETRIDKNAKEIIIARKGTGESIVTDSYEDRIEDAQIPEEVVFYPNTQIETERGNIYITVSMKLKLSEGEVLLPRRLKLEIVYQENDPCFILRPAEQLDLIAMNKDQTVAAYGTSPETTYQDMILRVEDTFYDTGLQWHTDYGEAKMQQWDYDGDGYIETAFAYPYGTSNSLDYGLLIIDRDDAGNVFWTDVFPEEEWLLGSVEKQWKEFLDWDIDEKEKRVRVTDAFTGKELLNTVYDEEETGKGTDQIEEIIYTLNRTYILEEGKLYMECSPAIVFEQSMLPYYLDGTIRMEVVYEEGKSGLISCQKANEARGESLLEEESRELLENAERKVEEIITQEDVALWENIQERKIEEHSFELELNAWGKVTFVSCLPEQREELGPCIDPSFYLVDDTKVIYHFPDVFPDNIRTVARRLYYGISFVSFEDINKDNRDDIIIGILCFTGAGREGAIVHTEIRVYEDNGSEFVYNRRMCDEINPYLQGEVSAKEIKDLIFNYQKAGSLDS